MNTSRTYFDFIGRMKARREALGLSVPEVARKLARDRSTLSRWETYQCVPGIMEAIEWARILGLTITVADVQRHNEGN